MNREIIYQIGDRVTTREGKGTIVFKEPNTKSKKIWGLDNIKSLESIGLWVYLIRYDNGNYSNVCRYYELNFKEDEN